MKVNSSIVYNTKKLEISQVSIQLAGVYVNTIQYKKGNLAETCSNLDDLKKLC